MGVSVLKCPSCGAPAGAAARLCEFCGASLVQDTLGLGLLSMDKGSVNQLMKEARERLAAHPDDAAAHCRLGVCLFKRREYEEAISEFETTTRLSPQAWGVFYLEAFAVAVGRSWLNPRVVERAERALSLNPLMKEAQSLLHLYHGVEMLELSGGRPNYDGALAEFREALALKVPEQLPYVYYYSGVALDEGGDADDAVKMYQQACQLGYVDAKILTRLGILLSEAGQTQLAIWELEKAVELEPLNQPVAKLLASLKAKRGGNPQERR